MRNKYVLEILKEYEQLQEYAKSEQKQRQMEIYNKFPRIKAIDAAVSQIGFDIASSIFKGIDIESYISEQKKRITDLKVEKSEILAGNRYPINYLDLKYHCNKCKDTGYVENNRCSCFRQKLIDKHYKQSNLAAILMKENFDNFDLSLYSDRKLEGMGISPLENIKRILTHCITYSNNFDSTNENLFFTGSPGLGKTFLSNCIAKDLLDRGKVVIYQTSSALIDILRTSKFGENTDSEYIKEILECDLLIIDDLGTESNNSYSQSELFNIINTRILTNKKMIVSTNISIEELNNYYPDRIASRLLGNFTVFEFLGDDIRISKNVMRRNKSR